VVRYLVRGHCEAFVDQVSAKGFESLFGETSRQLSIGYTPIMEFALSVRAVGNCTLITCDQQDTDQIDRAS
jgi:hypothetical protein